MESRQSRGADVVLTLDETIQWIAERALTELCESGTVPEVLTDLNLRTDLSWVRLPETELSDWSSYNLSLINAQRAGRKAEDLVSVLRRWLVAPEPS